MKTEIDIVLDLIHTVLIVTKTHGWTEERKETLLALNEALTQAIKAA